MSRPIGLHLRITNTLQMLFERAYLLGLSAVQFFFVQQETGASYRLSGREVATIVRLQQAQPIKAFVHASFWANLADTQRTVHPLLNRDIEQAQLLGVDSIVAHPGSYKGVSAKKQALEHIILVLEDLFRRYPDVTILLENVSHQGKSVGGAIDDLGYLAKRLSTTQLGFCIDTSHAHAFGYDIVSAEGQREFIALVDREIGWHRVHLLHLNDTIEECGSNIDVHAIPGCGAIGWDALIAFATDIQVSGVPIIMEVPEIDIQEQESVVRMLQDRLSCLSEDQ